MPPQVRDPADELMLQATTFANSLTVLDRFGAAVDITERRPGHDRRAA